MKVKMFIAVILALILTLGTALSAGAVSSDPSVAAKELQKTLQQALEIMAGDTTSGISPNLLTAAVGGINVTEDNTSKDGGYIITLFGKNLYIDADGVITDANGRVLAVNAFDENGFSQNLNNILIGALAEPPVKEVDGKDVPDTTGGYISDGKLYLDKECTQEYIGDFSENPIPKFYTKWTLVVEFDADKLLLALQGNWGNEGRIFLKLAEGYRLGQKNFWGTIGGSDTLGLTPMGNGITIKGLGTGSCRIIFTHGGTGATCSMLVTVVGHRNKPSEGDGPNRRNLGNTEPQPKPPAPPSYKCCEYCETNDCPPCIGGDSPCYYTTDASGGCTNKDCNPPR